VAAFFISGHGIFTPHTMRCLHDRNKHTTHSRKPDGAMGLAIYVGKAVG
jgi:hypothetical protein